MDHLTQYVRRHFTTLVLLSVLAGFALILVELLVTQHYDGIQLVAPISCGVGILLSATALWFAPGRSAIAVLLLLLALTGLFGAFEHQEEGGEEEARASTTVVMQVSDEGSESPTTVSESEAGENEVGEAESIERGERGEGEGEEEEGNPPPLAPLSLSGLAFLGALSVIAQGAVRQEATR